MNEIQDKDTYLALVGLSETTIFPLMDIVSAYEKLGDVRLVRAACYLSVTTKIPMLSRDPLVRDVCDSIKLSIG